LPVVRPVTGLDRRATTRDGRGIERRLAAMAGEVSKQDQALTRGAQMVSTARGDLDQQLGSLRGKLSGIGAQWRGAGSMAFQQVMTRWDEDARKITSALNEFEANLRASEQTYNANDETQSSTFSKLSGRLG
jgi:WXG100 family type VII secretion target